MSILGIMLMAAAVLAIIVSALVIGVCLLISWASDALRGQSQQEMHGQDGPRAMAHGFAEGRHRNASRPPTASRRIGR